MTDVAEVTRGEKELDVVAEKDTWRKMN